MKCLKCGAYVYSSDKFCRSCGTTLNSDTCQYGDNIPSSAYDSSSCHTTQYNYSYEYSNKEKPEYDMNATHEQQYNYNTNYSYDISKYNYAYQPNDSGEDKYIKNFIGNNYERIKKLKFSFPALIFGPLYLLYRKLWGYALAVIIISVAASFLLNPEIADIINIIIRIYLACNFKNIYMKHVENKVEQIKQQGLDKTTEELLNSCKKKGGTAFKVVIVSTVIPIIIFCALITYFATIFDYQPDDSYLDYEESPITTENVNKLYYTIPESFSKYYSTESQKQYKSTSSTTTCEFLIENKTYNTMDPETYLNSQQPEFNYPIKSINYNGNTWKYKNLIQLTYKTIYAYEYEGSLYLVTLNNTNYYNCNSEYKTLLQSLNFK